MLRLPEGDDIENGIAWFTQTTVTMTSLGMRFRQPAHCSWFSRRT